MLSLLIAALPLLARVSAAPLQAPMPLGGAPTTLNANTTAVLHLANFLENLEYQLYTGACNNFTDANWTAAGFPENYREDVICKSAEQELDHIRALEAALIAGGASTIPTCGSYSFPYETPAEFANLANMVTTVGIGAYMGGALALAGSSPLLLAAVSILPIEARHSASLRLPQAGVLPFPLPFDTALSAAWAYNLALPMAVDCPVYLNITTLPALSQTAPDPMPPHAPNATAFPANVTFSWDPASLAAGANATHFAWLNQAANVSFVPVVSCGDGCGVSAVPDGVNAVAFVVLTDVDSVGGDEDWLTNHTIAGPAEVVIG